YLLTFSQRKVVLLNYTTFLEKLTKEVKNQAGAQARVSINRIQKINLPESDGMTILFPGENASPAIYVNSFYQENLRESDIPAIAAQVLSIHQENKSATSCDLSFYTDFEKSQRSIVCRLINYEKNRELLKTIPHRQILDLAIVYYYQMENSVWGKSSILVRNSHIAMWQISNDDLHAMAMQNTRLLLPMHITTLGEMLSDLPDCPLPTPEEDPPSMYVLTNKDMCYGAINIVFDDILHAVSTRLGGDFYVLPSSIHECLLLPVSSWNDTEPQRLQEIVAEINEKYIAAEEVLGNHVYRYFQNSGSLCLMA
ncbi:MAG: DUF5688 family protein, partial [Clostridiales bacterium]|nr:DUF5688 family protein [Clostridiales bacterium]